MLKSQRADAIAPPRTDSRKPIAFSTRTPSTSSHSRLLLALTRNQILLGGGSGCRLCQNPGKGNASQSLDQILKRLDFGADRRFDLNRGHGSILVNQGTYKNSLQFSIARAKSAQAAPSGAAIEQSSEPPGLLTGCP